MAVKDIWLPAYGIWKRWHETRTPEAYVEGVDVSGVTAGVLASGGLGSERVTCSPANSDVPATINIPAGTKLVLIGCDYSCIVAVGEVTSTTVGAFIPAGGGFYPVKPADVIAGMVLHVQSPTNGAIVRFTYLAE
jgi:hypothetical protein